MTHRWLIGTMGVLALAMALAMSGAGGQASLAEDNIIYVDADADPGGLGTSWMDAYTDLQLALEDAEAVAPAQIWVAAGTYKPSVEQGGSGDRYWSFQMANGVAIYGGFDPSVGDTEWKDRDWANNTTILSGNIGDEGTNTDNSYHVFYHPEELALDSTAILDGFTITGANANGSFPHDSGGGMYNAGFRNFQSDCGFSGNSAVIGGGMSNGSSSPTVTNCTFSGNSAGTDGGGMSNGYSSSPTLTNCIFEGNEAGSYGGGMYNVDSSPVVTNCTFTDNSAGWGWGGGMYNVDSSPVLTNCTFNDNSTPHWGGGMYNSNSSPALTDCTFSGNSAYCGGGMYNYQSSPTLTNCSFVGNSANYGGGGMYNKDGSSPMVTNCTFSSNSAEYGGGMFNASSSPMLTNCILWGDTADTDPEIHNLDIPPLVTYSDIQGDAPYPGMDNINADPLFLGPGSGNIHLGPGSPCIDAGTESVPDPPGLPDYDFEGDPRILDGDADGDPIVDMGVDEAQWHPVYLPVVLRGY